MKSKIAEEKLDVKNIAHYDIGEGGSLIVIDLTDAQEAVEIAEEEAEEGIRHKAERAFYYSCNFCDGDGGCKRSKTVCQMSCKTAKHFINELNK